MAHLVALASPDSVFLGWSGACTGSATTCDVTMAQAVTVGAAFGIRNHPPVASAGGPYSGTRLAAIALNGSASSDPDGDALSYAWSFGDGGTGVGIAPTHHYATVGDFTVTLTVNDGTVDSAPVSTLVQILNLPPTVALTAPANNAQFAAPASITVTANAADADGTIAQVEFFRGATSLGVDTTSPYSVTWSGAAGGLVPPHRGGHG